MRTVVLHKVEAAGNDFLVGLAPLATTLERADVVAACDRYRGIGADGLIALTPLAPGRVGFALTNADGSPAETSGNGLRCAALVAHRLGLGASLVFSTPAGAARSELAVDSPVRASVEVEMGLVRTELEEATIEGFRAARVDVGNPHLVLFDGPFDLIDLERLGARWNEEIPGGVNVELVRLDGTDRLRLRVYERGVGLTLACGSGSVAAAAALHRAGLVGPRVVVDNPGGTLGVELEPADERTYRARLSGDAHYVARIELYLDAADVGAGVGTGGER